MSFDYGVYKLMKYATSKKPEVLKEALESDNYCIQLKRDGASYILAKDADGSVHLYKDSISKKTGTFVDKIDNVPLIKKFAERYFPKESQLLVEICYGETSKDVNTIMLALPQKAISRQADTKPVEAYIFDCLFWNGEPIYAKDFADRWAFIESEWYSWLSYEPIPDWLSKAETVYENKTEALSSWLNSGEEGGVLKLLHSTPKLSAAFQLRNIEQSAARPMHVTYKIKQVDTADVVIIGIQLPDSEYKGKDPDNYQYRDENNNPVNRLYALNMINAFEIGAYDSNGNLAKIGTVSSGLTDEIRSEAFYNPEKFIGITIEIEAMSKDNAAHTLRHPRLIHSRPDKPATDCKMEDIFS